MQTTTEDLARLYDKTVKLLEKRVDDGTAAAADIANLLRLLEKADFLELLRHPPGTGQTATQTRDLPFPGPEALRPN